MPIFALECLSLGQTSLSSLAVSTGPSPKRYKSVLHFNCPSEFFPYDEVQPVISPFLPFCLAEKCHFCWFSCEGSWSCLSCFAELESRLRESQEDHEGFPSNHWEVGACNLCLRENRCLKAQDLQRIPFSLPEIELFGNSVCEGLTYFRKSQPKNQTSETAIL